MRKLQFIIVLTLVLLPSLAGAQKRYSTSDHREYKLGSSSGFSTKDVENKTDALFGLHASQYSGSHHLIGLAAEGGWSAFVSSLPAAALTPGGGIAGLNLLYEYQYSGFLLQTGLGVRYQRVFTAVADTSIYHEHMTSTWNGVPAEYTLKHRFENRLDMAQQLYARLPLYFGHYFFGSSGIGYFLAGIHADYAFWGSTQTTVTGTTSGKYQHYVGIWEEMPNHGFRKEVPLTRTGDPLKLKFDLGAHLEIGYEYNTRQGMKDYRVRPSDRLDGRLRLAAFIDFSVLDICPKTREALYELPEATILDYPTYQMSHVYASADAATSWLRNLSVGIRVTFLIGFQPEERCILCDPWRH